MDVLARIDAAIAGACPCGADLQPGSAYCGDDCVPTYRAVDTTSDLDGTAMRWRPDLVSEVDDSRLTLINGFRRGPYHAQLFGIDGSDDVHYRLDDGNRFVGVDVNGRQGTAGLEPVWVRLERELGDGRHVEADPWADVMRRYGGIVDDMVLRAEGRDHAVETSMTRFRRLAATTPSLGMRLYTAPAGSDPADSDAWTDLGFLRDDGLNYTDGGWGSADAGSAFVAFDNSVATFTPAPTTAPSAVLETMRRAYEGIEAMRPLFAQYGQAMAGLAAQLNVPAQPPEPDHPMLAAIERRRNRNTGPERRQRPPKQISPRR